MSNVIEVDFRNNDKIVIKDGCDELLIHPLDVECIEMIGSEGRLCRTSEAPTAMSITIFALIAEGIYL